MESQSNTQKNINKRWAVYKKTNGCCAYCGRKIEFKNMVADHVVPRSRGGKNTIDNLLPACFFCDQYKKNKTLEKFRASIEKFHLILWGTLHIERL